MRYCQFIVVSVIVFTWSFLSAAAQTSTEGAAPTIVVPADPTSLQVRASREVLRYLYLCTGMCADISREIPASGDAIIIRTDRDHLGEQTYRLGTEECGDRRILTLSGGSDIATLYAAYRFAELLGVRFYLHGDVVPDGVIQHWRVPIAEEQSEPLFALRGILPFHDFTEGPDWWDLDDYKAYLSQLARLRMNFFALHCYPEGGVGPEPSVWIGLPEDVNADGSVLFSYPTRWASTLGGAWGYMPTPTSQFAAGASLLFNRGDYGPEVTEGHRPKAIDPTGCDEVFHRTAALFGDAFDYGHGLGIKFCLGTESPLTIPAAVQQRLGEQGKDPNDPAVVRTLYEGIFIRIARSHPLDYYWLWTPEGWTWQGASREQVDATVSDIELALEALDNVGNPFRFATCGWVLGPPSDRALFDRIFPRDVALSCINRQVGFEPVEQGFATVNDRPKWAIPWLEDDPAMIIPQFWAGRMRRDAADAMAYGCTGLIGIHWRTKVLAPNIGALAQAGWSQADWDPDWGRTIELPAAPTTDVHIGGQTAYYDRNEIADTDDDDIYRSCRWNVDAYRIDVPNGRYAITLKFCEIHYREAGKRVFGAVINGRQVLRGLDVFARVGRNMPLDIKFEDVTVDNEELLIEFTREIEYPFIAAIVIDGMTAGSNQLRGERYTRKINCGGGECRGYEAALPGAGVVIDSRDRPRDLPADDFYADWALAEFGPEVAAPLAALFARLDGSPRDGSTRAACLPRPSDWDRGPGGIPPNPAPWAEEQARYAFISEMELLRPRVIGAGNLERFDYWLNTFRFLRSVGHAGCVRGRLDAIVKLIEREEDPSRRARLAREQALPVRIELARIWEKLMTHQLAVVSTPGGMGTVANLEQHVRRNNAFLSLHDALLTSLLGELPDRADPSLDYFGSPRIIVPTVRSDVSEGEMLNISIIVLDREPASEVTLHWRAPGDATCQEVHARNVGRAVYECDFSPGSEACTEYYITASTAGGANLIWPSTAPERGQTVITVPAGH